VNDSIKDINSVVPHISISSANPTQSLQLLRIVLKYHSKAPNTVCKGNISERQ